MSVLDGYVDYSVYASFCISVLSLVIYRSGRNLSDLMLFVVAACICMTTKTTGILCVGLLVILTLPLLWRRAAYWHALLALGLLVAVVGASPLLTAWIQYGSPLYPSMTFNPDVPLVDITCDLTGNADAMSMGYLSRICYAWVSPKLTVAAIRLLGGNPGFSPVFPIHPVAGIGLWFNILLLVSVVLLALARKNIVTWLCVVIFVSSNFAPLKFIGYERYFSQIWAIFPLAVMNYVCVTRRVISGTRLKRVHKTVSVVVLITLVGLVGASLYRTARRFCRMMVLEGARQSLIASLPRKVEVEEPFFVYTAVQRFRQAGVEMTRKGEGVLTSDAAVWDWGPSYADMPRRDPVTLRVALPSKDKSRPRKPARLTTLPCTDVRTGERFALCSNMSFNRPGEDEDWVKTLYTTKGKLRALIDNFPHVLWDNGQGGSK